MYSFVLGALAIWRITHAFNAEDGPAGLLAGLRHGLGNGFWGSLLDCFYCLSLWIALPFAVLIGSSLAECTLLWFALSGAACLLERFSSAAGATSPAIYWEEKENQNALLRKR